MKPELNRVESWWGGARTPEREDGETPLGQALYRSHFFQISVSGVGRKGTHSGAEGRAGSVRLLQFVKCKDPHAYSWF